MICFTVTPGEGRRPSPRTLRETWDKLSDDVIKDSPQLDVTQTINETARRTAMHFGMQYKEL